MKSITLLIVSTVMLSISGATQITGSGMQQPVYPDNDSIVQFEILLDSLRINLKIPAISAAVIKYSHIHHNINPEKFLDIVVLVLVTWRR